MRSARSPRTSGSGRWPSRRGGAAALARRAAALQRDLDEDAAHPDFADGQALTALLEAGEQVRIKDAIQGRVYLQGGEAASRLERMAGRARETGRPQVEAACWQRAAFVWLAALRPSGDRGEPLRSVIAAAGRYGQDSGQAARGELADALFNLGRARYRQENWAGAERATAEAAGEWAARRAELPGYEARLAFQERWSDLLDDLRETALRQGDLAAALRWTTGGKSRALSDLIASQHWGSETV